MIDSPQEPSEIVYAKRVLVHYIRTAWEAAGLKWDNWDNTSEVEDVVQAIFDAARKEIARDAS
jgi:hypothetical protein